MRNNIVVRIVSIALLALMLAGYMLPANFCVEADAASGNTEAVIDGILKWKNNGSAQDLVEDISADMGSSTADWYVIALSRYKHRLDFSSCVDTLDSFASSAGNLRATDKQRIAIAFTAMGSNSPYINTALNDSIGNLGVMSYIYGLIMLDCGAYYGSMTRNEIINELLSLQQSDGGWGLSQVSDVDVTAMVVQSLARYCKHSDVNSAVSKALTYLSQRQQDSGAFKSYGTESAESTAQVLLALNTMNIDIKTDSRFIKNGNTVYDGLMQFRRSDGSFSHAMGGGANQLATVQSLYSLVSLWRYENGKSPFFEFVGNTIERETSDKSTPSQSTSSKPSGTSTSSTPASSRNDVEASNEHQAGQSAASTPTESHSSDTNTASSSVQSSDFSESSLAESVSEKSETGAANSSQQNESAVSSETTAMSPDTSVTDNSVNGESALPDDGVTQESFGIKLILVICIAAVLGAVIIVMIVKKKFNRKNVIFLALICAGLICFLLTLRIETPSQYYDATSTESTATSGTIAFSISCENAIGKTDNEKIPQDGMIFTDTEFAIGESDTVFDVLLRVAKQNRIQLDYDGGENGGLVYVKGIDYLYEFDCGELSGWTYMVNGETPNVGCAEYELKDGDVIEWLYTTDLGKDIEG